MLTTPALFLALSLVLRPAGGIDYCRDVAKDCGGGTNIVCRRKNNCGTASNCAKVTIHKNIKDVMVDKFNDIRNKVALGQGPISGSTGANMRAMSWDDELAYIAQCAVNLCEERLKKACPVSSKYSYGHILYTIKLMSSFDDELDFFEETVKEWADRGKGMGSSSDFKSDSHYDFAAIIMAKGGGVGCGWSRVKKSILYDGSNGHFFFAACVFAVMPRSEAAFQDGTPCSKCPSGTSCNSRYKGLCGEIQYAQRGSNEDDDYYDYHDGHRGRCVGRRASLSLILGAALLTAGCQVLTWM